MLQEWNRGAELLTGFTKEEAVGKRLVQRFIADELFGCNGPCPVGGFAHAD